MTTNADHFAAAAELQKLFGSDANLRAAMRADKALDEGDTDGFHFWKNVEGALRPRAHEQQN